MNMIIIMEWLFNQHYQGSKEKNNYIINNIHSNVHKFDIPYDLLSGFDKIVLSDYLLLYKEMTTYIGFYDEKKSNLNFLIYVSNLTTQSWRIIPFYKNEDKFFTILLL